MIVFHNFCRESHSISADHEVFRSTEPVSLLLLIGFHELIIIVVLVNMRYIFFELLSDCLSEGGHYLKFTSIQISLKHLVIFDILLSFSLNKLTIEKSLIIFNIGFHFLDLREFNFKIKFASPILLRVLSAFESKDVCSAKDRSVENHEGKVHGKYFEKANGAIIHMLLMH